MTEKTIRILLADDHRFFRDGVRAMLESVPGFVIVAEANNGTEAVEAARAHKPDVIMMDMQMPGLNGVEATREISTISPATGVLIVTMFEDTDTVVASMRAGARGYILKDVGEEEMVRSIRAVANGEALFGPAVARRLMQYIMQAPATSASANSFSDLGDREREILGLLAQGISNAKIADKLQLSLKTVRNYVSNILAKLHAVDREDAIARARKAGLVE